MNIINEPGLYTLVLGSRKPEARAFRRWITHEVLPSIRRYGAYLSGAAINDPEMAELLMETVKRMKTDNDRLQQQLNWERSGKGRRAPRTPEAAALPEKCCEGFVETIWSLIDSGEVKVISPYAPQAALPDNDTVGYLDCQYLYLIPPRMFERINADKERFGEIFPLTKRMLYKMLRSGGYVLGDTNGKATRCKCVGGKMMRLLWLPRRTDRAETT